ncbi:hypothetical protein GCM10009765_62440 [Fodinicola feengrottensis]|uniref:Uncharacterized protein n=2 Tax=Fodinicola feengrottensis TaxID=435914 RepID=A0ABP4UJ07_9ACTN
MGALRARSGWLLWIGVAFAPIAALLLAFGQGSSPLRIAAVLALVAVVLIGLAVVLRPEPADLAEEITDSLQREVDQVRDEVDGVRRDVERSLRAELDTVRAELERSRRQRSGQQSNRPVASGEGTVLDLRTPGRATVPLPSAPVSNGPGESERDPDRAGRGGRGGPRTPVGSRGRADVPAAPRGSAQVTRDAAERRDFECSQRTVSERVPARAEYEEHTRPVSGGRSGSVSGSAPVSGGRSGSVSGSVPVNGGRAEVPVNGRGASVSGSARPVSGGRSGSVPVNGGRAEVPLSGGRTGSVSGSARPVSGGRSGSVPVNGGRAEVPMGGDRSGSVPVNGGRADGVGRADAPVSGGRSGSARPVSGGRSGSVPVTGGRSRVPAADRTEMMPMLDDVPEAPRRSERTGGAARVGGRDPELVGQLDEWLESRERPQTGRTYGSAGTGSGGTGSNGRRQEPAASMDQASINGGAMPQWDSYSVDRAEIDRPADNDDPLFGAMPPAANASSLGFGTAGSATDWRPSGWEPPAEPAPEPVTLRPLLPAARTDNEISSGFAVENRYDYEPAETPRSRRRAADNDTGYSGGRRSAAYGGGHSSSTSSRTDVLGRHSQPPASGSGRHSRGDSSAY